VTNAARTGGRILIDGLIAYGMDTLFCVPGESYLGALDALYDRQDDVTIITCRQEGGASYMAEAYGKLTGNPGICFVSRGPGAANAMIGIHTAYQDSTPLLLFIGQIARGDEGREAFQELDYRQVYAGVAKKVLTFRDARRVPEQLQRAWHTAISGRPGPVVIELPEDMLTAEAVVNDLRPKRVSFPAPDPRAVDRFSKWLDQAERPLILCGGAAWTETASRLLQTFSETRQIPVATTFRRSDTFDNTHPHYAGEFAIAPNPELVRLLQSSDLLIALGPRLGDITTSGYQLFDVPDGISNREDQRLIHIHVEPEALNSVYQADLAIACHPELFLREVSRKPAAGKDRSTLLREAHQAYLDFTFAPKNQAAALRMDKVAETLRKRLPADAIVANGAGNYTVWTQRYYQFRQPHTQLAPTNGSMGYGVPAAIAAKIVKPEKIVVSFSGDGCFMMNGQELATAVQYALNIVFLVINNCTYGTIQMHQERNFPNRRIATRLDNPIAI